jgi:hypothetical protein
VRLSSADQEQCGFGTVSEELSFVATAREDNQNALIGQDEAGAARKLRARLGEASSHVDPIPERPYGMWQRTYDRLVERVEALEAAALDTANMELRKLMARRGWFFEKR